MQSVFVVIYCSPCCFATSLATSSILFLYCFYRIYLKCICTSSLMNVKHRGVTEVQVVQRTKRQVKAPDAQLSK